MGQEVADHGVARLVVGGQFLLFARHDTALAFRAELDALDGFLELAHADALAVAAGSQQGGFIDRILDVGADEARRGLGQHDDVDGVGDGLAAQVDAEDGLAAAHVGPVDDDAAVETPRPQQRRVEDVRTVGGGQDDDVGVGVEAVHLDQNLVERLLALVVGTTQAGATLAADGVDLVNKNDTRAVPLGLLEQVAYAAGADADEHLDEFGAGDGEEGHTGLAGNGLGQQRLAGAWAADQQNALGDARAEGDKLLRLLQELDDLLQLFLGLVAAGHVLEADRGVVAGEHARPTLAERHGLIVRTLCLAEDEVKEANDEQSGQEDADEIEQAAPLAGPLVGDDRPVVAIIIAGDAIGGQDFFDGTDGADGCPRRWAIVGGVDDRHLAAVAGHKQLGHFVGLYLLRQLADRNVILRRRRGAIAPQNGCDCRPYQKVDEPPCQAGRIHVYASGYRRNSCLPILAAIGQEYKVP